MHLDQPINHLPLAITHVNLGVVLGDAEFFTSPKVGGYLRAMDDILLGRQAMSGQEPPIYFRSTTIARIPFFA
jgi:hypothetical protein